MDFKTYYLDLPADKREPFAVSLGTSAGYCLQLCYGDKKIELGFADVIVAKTKGVVTLDELPLTQRARDQIEARKWNGPNRRAKKDCPCEPLSSK